MAVKIQYTQGVTVGNVGQALVGNIGAAVVAKDGHAVAGEGATYRWTWVDVPTSSAIPRGLIIEGPVTSVTFTPDARGDFHLMVEKYDAKGFRTVDKRVFRVNLASGRSLPAFDAEADALNFSGQGLGWKPDMEAWLVFIDALVTASNPSSGANHVVQTSNGTGGFSGATGVTANGSALNAGTLGLTSDATVGGAGIFTGNLSGAAISGTSLTVSSFVAAGASPAAAGVYRAPSVAAQLLMAGTKTLLGTGTTDGYLFSDSSFGNQATNGYIFAGTNVLMGVGSSGLVSLLSNEVRMAIGANNNWSFGSNSPTYGSGVGVGFRRNAGTIPSTNPTGGVIDYVDGNDLLPKARMGDGRIAVMDLANPAICDLCLTLRTGEPIPTADTASGSTLYFSPLRSGSIMLYNTVSSSWQLRVTGEISISLLGLTSGANHDVFAYWNGSSVALELSVAWGSNTTRTDALVRQDGVLVKSANRSRRYVGTIRAISSSATTDTVTQRYVWNYNNRTRRPLMVFDTTASWTYASNVFRAANGTTTNHMFEIVCGDVTDAQASVSVMAGMTTNQGHIRVGVGIDSTSVDSAFAGGHLIPVGGFAQRDCQWNGILTLGYHQIVWLEQGENATATFFGDGSGATRSARMRGSIMG